MVGLCKFCNILFLIESETKVLTVWNTRLHKKYVERSMCFVQAYAGCKEY